MKLNISTVALVALAAMVSAAAAGASQDKADAQKPATMDAPGMTITGCVARGTAADTFTLAEVKKGAPVAADASTPAPLVISFPVRASPSAMSSGKPAPETQVRS